MRHKNVSSGCGILKLAPGLTFFGLRSIPVAEDTGFLHRSWRIRKLKCVSDTAFPCDLEIYFESCYFLAKIAAILSIIAPLEETRHCHTVAKAHSLAKKVGRQKLADGRLSVAPRLKAPAEISIFQKAQRALSCSRSARAAGRGPKNGGIRQSSRTSAARTCECFWRAA
jgi:hypothetical protein